MKAIAERVHTTHTGSLLRLPWLPIAEPRRLSARPPDQPGAMGVARSRGEDPHLLVVVTRRGPRGMVLAPDRLVRRRRGVLR